MNKPDELEKNNQLRRDALAPVVAELVEINRQMSELNKEMIHQATIILELLMRMYNDANK